MKKNYLVALMCLMTINARALTVQVAEYGEIPAEGLEITVTDAYPDLLTGKMTMSIEGTLSCESSLEVTISRATEELEDEFCCSGHCHPGNGETTQTMTFSFGSQATWFAHYYPAADSQETIVYTFSADSTEKTLTVHYHYSAQGVEDVQTKDEGTKVLRDGILYIEKNNKTYTIL